MSDDLISRKAVLDKIKEVCFSEEWAKYRIDNGSNGQRDYIIRYIEELPTYSPTFKPIAEIKIDSGEVAEKMLEKIKNGEWIISSDSTEQKDSVLDDIKAEIKELTNQSMFGYVSNSDLLDVVVEIIDNHISGKEQE